MLLVPVPWAAPLGPAVPGDPDLHPAISARLRKPHRTTGADRGRGPSHPPLAARHTIHLVGDSGFAVVRLAHVCGAARVGWSPA